ncbi:MAG: hypothetical protein JF887_11680 [Candidatus Dormibacteraeota bacterium]|uniref:Uncharacterized protein n=1 Tax=Candidatus Amunia macphersoniae TaxID=3127014 RepID=A0A934NAE9_9BACT|nr:hypothetical protein [Candidatus Dormibacteraeota bacterium]
MATSGGGGGGEIRVDPAALLAVAQRLHAEAGGTAQVLAASGRAGASGCPEVDAAMTNFEGQWTRQVQMLSQTTEAFAAAVASAAADYQHTDAAVMPGAGP